jgi:hypothetical protein
MNRTKKILFVSALAIISIIGTILYKTHKIKESSQEIPEDDKPWIEYFQDSTYKVCITKTIDVYKVKNGRKIKSIEKGLDRVIAVAIHPSGNHLVVLDENYLSVYNLKKKGHKPILEKMVGQEYDYIDFSKDGKYLLVIDYKDVEVSIYRWPGLKYLATGYMGFYRNSFWWENHAGKLIFYYRENNYTYKTVFPANPRAPILRFSKEVVVDSIPENN